MLMALLWPLVSASVPLIGGGGPTLERNRLRPIFGAIHLLTERLRACESTIYFERLLREDFA